MANISEQVAALVPRAIELRRDLHMHPEVGFQEVRTSGLLAARLRDRASSRAHAHPRPARSRGRRHPSRRDRQCGLRLTV